ncbi:MAG: lipopolysaccharide biosynthesis protein [Bacteroidales bacterium]
MSDNRKIAVNTLALFFRMVVNVIIMLYVSKVILRELGIIDFGIYNIVAGLVVFFAFVNESMGTASQRFISFAIGRSDPRLISNTLNVSVLVHFIIAVVVIILAETIGYYYFERNIVIPIDRYDISRVVYHFSAITLFVNLLLVPVSAWLNANEDLVIVAVFGFIETILKLILSVLLAQSVFDKLITYSLGLLFISIISFFIQVIYSYLRYSNFRLSRLIDPGILKQVGVFASFGLIGNLSTIGRTQGNALLLNMFFGVILNTAYALSNQVITQVVNFSTIITRSFMPQIVKSFSNGDLTRFQILIFNSLRYSFIVMSILVVPLIGEIEFVLSLWIDTYPPITVNICRLMLIQSVLFAVIYPLDLSLQALGRIKLNQILVALVTISSMSFSYFALVNGSDPEIVIWANIFNYITIFIFRIIYLRRVVRISLYRFFSEVVIKIVIISIIAYVLLRLSYLFSDYTLIRILFVSTSFGVTSLLIGLKREEIIFLFNYILYKTKMFKRI